MEQHTSLRMSRIFGWIFALLAFFIPVFFVPLSAVPLSVGKGLFVGVVLLGTFIAWCAHILLHGSITFPRVPLVYALVLLPILYTVSALGAFDLSTALVGRVGSVNSALAIFLFTIIALGAARALTSRLFLFVAYGAALASFIVLFGFHFIRFLIGPEFLSAGIMNTLTDTPFVGWYSFALATVATGVLVFSAIDMLSLSRRIRVVLSMVLGGVLIALAAINFQTAWILLGTSAVLFILYVTLFNRYTTEESGTVTLARDVQGVHARADIRIAVGKRVPAAAIVTLGVALVMTLGAYAFTLVSESSTPPATRFPSMLGINYGEVRPSLGATYDVARYAWGESFLVGTGPGSFEHVWHMARPESVNTTNLWSVDFTSGIGLIPTAVATGGAFVALGWLLFLGAFLYAGYTSILVPARNTFLYYVRVSSYFSALVLIGGCIFYSPSLPVFLGAALFVGIHLASRSVDRSLPMTTLVFQEHRRAGFLVMGGTVALALIALVFFAVVLRATIATGYFESGRRMVVEGDHEHAERQFTRALGWYERGRYHSALSEIGLVKINNLLLNASLEDEATLRAFQEQLGEAIDHTRSATEQEPYNYNHWLSLARIYEAVVPLGIAGAYENAHSAYDRAEELNPKSPGIPFLRARLEFIRNDFEKARAQIAIALERKPNYTEAIFLLSQVEVALGNTDEAIRAAESTALLAPNDAVVHFQLGVLNYNSGRYEEAARELGRAVVLNPSYANARYFLGLSYAELGRSADALTQFEYIRQANPNNTEVTTVIENLRAGREPLAGIVEEESDDVVPEDLPLEE